MTEEFKSHARAKFAQLTQGRIDRLWGPRMAGYRADIMAAAYGLPKLAKSKAGWEKFRKLMLEIHGITAGQCDAERDRLLEELVSGQS